MIDLRTILGMEAIDYTGRTCLIVIIVINPAVLRYTC